MTGHRSRRCADRLVALAMAIGCCALSACTSHMAYRKSFGFVRRPAEGVTVSVIELDEHGEFWSRHQLAAALGEINAAQAGKETGKDGGKKGPGAIVVAFVHGWKNNASHGNEDDENGNLHKFIIILQKIRKLEVASTAPNETPRPVAGVYLGWRGESIHPIPVIQELSIYSRYIAAQRVAASPAPTEALLTVLAVGRANPRSRTIVVGHSLGGLIVEKAFSQMLVNLATDKALENLNPEGATPVPAAFPADLIVLVNPAAPALYARSLISSLQAWDLTVKKGVDPRFACKGSKRWRPLIVSVTSKGDTATGFFFPLGMKIGYSLQRYRAYDGTGPDDAPVDNAKRGQRYYATQTEGHVDQLFSHTLEHQSEAGGRDGVTVPCDDNPCAHPSVLCYVSGHSRFRLTQRDDTNNRFSPYWIMQAPVSLIADHSAFFVDPFVDMLGGLLEVNEIVAPTDPAASPATQRAPATPPAGAVPPTPP